MGIFNTGQFTQDLDAKSFSQTMIRLMPNGTAPLYGLSGMLGEETAINVEHGFFSKTMVFPEAKINNGAGYADSATTLVVDSTSYLLPGAVLRNERTGENMLILTVPDAVTITVARGVGSVAAAAILDNDDLYQVGTAFEESSTRPSANNIVPTRITNLTQIFRNTWAISGSAEAVEVIAGDTTMAENKQDAAAFHAQDMEKAIIWGQKSESTRNGQPFRTMDGLLNLVEDASYYPASYGGSTNSFTAGATTNYTQLETMLDVVFNQTTDPKNANERLLLVGGDAKKVLNNIGRLNGDYQLVDGQTNFGLQFSTLTISRGRFNIVEHPLFNTNSYWSKMAIAVDLATFRVANLKGRKTSHRFFNAKGESSAQDYGIDAIGGTYTTECTCVVKNVPANAVIRNLTAAAQG